LALKCLVDAGPLIALFDRDDHYHQVAKEFFKAYFGRLYTSWAVITEVLHMLDFNPQVQIDFLTWLQRDALEIIPLSKECIDRIINLSKKYSDIPMDFADATLIVIAEVKQIKAIISIDSDFYIYRNIRNEYLENVFKFR
jgi:predicted nucleic acid-binding protein